MSLKSGWGIYHIYFGTTGGMDKESVRPAMHLPEAPRECTGKNDARHWQKGRSRGKSGKEGARDLSRMSLWNHSVSAPLGRTGEFRVLGRISRNVPVSRRSSTRQMFRIMRVRRATVSLRWLVLLFRLLTRRFLGARPSVRPSRVLIPASCCCCFPFWP